MSMRRKGIASEPEGIHTVLKRGCHHWTTSIKVAMWLAILWSLVALSSGAPQEELHVGRHSRSGSIPKGSCAEARLRCAYRTGCGAALNNYLLWCSDVVHGASGCPESCQHALIALLSTEEGKNLMNCECNDDYCLETKQRVEVCKPEVLRASLNETVSCRVSQLICAADSLCATALDYYQRFCRSMFHGKKCSSRCLNSINILRRQDKAAKLSTCKCDGLENYDCPKVQTNMARLCFHKTKSRIGETTTVREDLRTNEVTAAASILRSTPLFLLVLLLVRYTVPD